MDWPSKEQVGGRSFADEGTSLADRKERHEEEDVVMEEGEVVTFFPVVL